MLDDLNAHFDKTENKSLIARIYGLYTIKTNIFGPLQLILMQNTAQNLYNHHPRISFDLKGSLFGRYNPLPSKENKFWKTTLNSKKILKDANFIEICKEIDFSLVELLQVDVGRVV